MSTEKGLFVRFGFLLLSSSLLFIASSCNRNNVQTIVHTKTSNFSGKTVIGWLEMVRIEDGNILMRAKMDSGAKTSSINCEEFAIYDANKDGAKRVRFTYKAHKGKSFEMDRPLLRLSQIKEHDGTTQERPVVMLKIRMKSIVLDVEVNLVNREELNYPLLLGRTFLQDAHAVVDVSETFTIPSKFYKSLAKTETVVHQ